jgi:RNAse (barnase) inhibitor barstar
MLGRLTKLYTRKRHLVNHSRRLTNSYTKITNLVNRVEEHLEEELLRIALG